MGLAVLLVVVGLADLVPERWDRRWLVTAAGLAALAAGGAGLRGGPSAWVVLAVSLVGFAGWRAGSRPGGRPAAVARRRTVALASLGLAVGVVVLVGGRGAAWRGPVGPAGSLLDAAHLPGTALALGVLLVQVATANRVVRLVLDAVGVPAARNERSLRGGRVLGPLERLLVVGLGLAGQLGAAAVVVAAKGLLRYPELQAAKHDNGPTDVSEYFLIGSFVSWLIAFGGALLVLGVAL